MDLASSQRQLRELEHYIDLGSKLERTVDKALRPFVRDTNGYLTDILPSYREIVRLETSAIRKRAQSEGIIAGAIYDIATECNIGVEDVKRMFKEDDKKSDNRRRIEYLLKITKNTILSVFSAPLSRETSTYYADIVRNYSSALKNLNEAARINKDTRQIRQRTLIKASENERKEAEIYSKLVSAGYDEAIAESIVLEGNTMLFKLLDSLKDYYGIE